MKGLDLLVFLSYLGGMLLLGVSFYRRHRSATSFALGDQQLPSWTITLSFFATFVSSISFLALPGSAYLSNWNAFVFSLTLPVAALIAVLFFIPIYRRINSPSAYTYLEHRFGKWASMYASICYLLNQLMRIGTILYLLAIALHAILGWNIPLIIILTGVMVLIYSLLGGIQAVVWTDAIQAIVLMVGALACIIYIILHIPGGVEEIWNIGQKEEKWSLGSWSFDLSQPTFWVVFIYGVFINLQNYGIDQNYVQRYMASHSEAAAKRSALIGGLIYLPVSAMFLFIGTALYAYYQSDIASLPNELATENMSDRIFPFFIVQELPSGMVGLMIAAIFAAGMSTISTSFNSAATVIWINFFSKHEQNSNAPKKAIHILYIASVVISILGIGIGLTMINVKSALDTWWKLASVFSGGMLGLFLLGAFAPLANARAAILGVIVGIVIILWISLSNVFSLFSSVSAPFHPYMAIVLGTSAIFLVGWLLSSLKNG